MPPCSAASRPSAALRPCGRLRVQPHGRRQHQAGHAGTGEQAGPPARPRQHRHQGDVGDEAAEAGLATQAAGGDSGGEAGGGAKPADGDVVDAEFSETK